MTRSDLPPGPEVPESTVSELQALYREAAQAEPGAALDHSILDAARAGLRDAAATKARRSPPWWKNWMPVASALAIALVGLSITWQVMDEQERDLRREMKAAEGVRERPAAGGATAAKGEADVPLAPGTPAPALEQGNRAESVAVKDAPPGAPSPAMPASAVPVLPAPAALGSMAPAPTGEAEKKSRRADGDEVQERRDAGSAADSVSARGRQSPKAEADSFGAGASSDAAAESTARPTAKAAAKSAAVPAAAPAVDAASPEAWLKQIRELRAAGRDMEAAQSLARFRARYPDVVLPEDLLHLK